MNSNLRTQRKKAGNDKTAVAAEVIGSEASSCDLGTNALLKVAMLSDIKPDSSDISDVFLAILRKYLLISTRSSIESFFSFLSFSRFREKFIFAAAEEIRRQRSSWLLQNCEPFILANMDAKGTQHYFLQLEENHFRDFVGGWKDPQDVLRREFRRVRKKFLFAFLKRNLHFLLFWCLIFLAIFIGLHITSKENSLTMWEQLKGWVFFLLQRLN